MHKFVTELLTQLAADHVETKSSFEQAASHDVLALVLVVSPLPQAVHEDPVAELLYEPRTQAMRARV